MLIFIAQRTGSGIMDRRSAENGDISIDMLTTDDFNGADILSDTAEPVDEQVIRKVMEDKLACLPFSAIGG